MAAFLRLLDEQEKRHGLLEACQAVRNADDDKRVFEFNHVGFRDIPSTPFAYWVSESVRNVFALFDRFERAGRKTSGGIGSTDDFRFVRTWWEVEVGHLSTDQSNVLEKSSAWVPMAHGGPYSPFYAEVYSVIQYGRDGLELKTFIEAKLGSASRNVRGQAYYFKAGLTWPLRGRTFSSWPLPRGSVFSVAGKMAYAPEEELLFWLSMFNSKAFDYLMRLFAGKIGGVQYESGLIAQLPIPDPNELFGSDLGELAHKVWSLKRTLDTVEETSHAFLLPAALRARLGDYDPPSIEAEMEEIQAEIDEIAFDFYGFDEADRAAAFGSSDSTDDAGESDDGEDVDSSTSVDQTDGLLSWAAGVAFGRFDWRLATGERAAPPEPEPFDPLPSKSPGMLPDDATPFHTHSGILVDDQGHPNDLARLIEEVLARVDAPVPADVRRWLQRDFFKFHLAQYSKSRRKAPIYWPISTSSGSYTLWLYYPSLTDQTLFIAVNDFIEPKLKQVGQDVATLRSKGSARTRDDEKNFEALQALELELIELRDTLLAIAPTYRPNQDDGVQITAAPLGQLFRHKQWQKVLKDTWAKLEKGDYDWAHLAMDYRPDRVREKCETDKSLAIAHDLEHLYVEP